jgi:hypothetical protein
MKIAMLTTRLFHTPRSGGEICTARLICALHDAGHELACIGRGSGAVDGEATLSVGAAVLPFDDLSATDRAVSAVGAIVRGQAITVQRANAAGAARRAGRALAAMAATPRDRPEVLFIDHLKTYAWVAEALADLPPVVLVMHNLEPDGYAERVHRTGGRGVGARLRRLMLAREARHLRALETVALRRATAVACLSEADAGCLRERAVACGSAARVVVLPGYPFAAPVATTRAAGRQATRRVGMIGTWTWEPNREALRWMLERVVPHWPDDCTLVLAGSGLEGLPLPARVVSLGRVDEASSFYAAVDVLAVPSLHGSGVQEKAIEAIGSGHVVVATTHATRGLAPGLPGQVHVADDARQFARLCAEVPVRTDAARWDTLQQWSEHRRAAYRAAVDLCIAAAVAPGHAVDHAARQSARRVAKVL